MMTRIRRDKHIEHLFMFKNTKQKWTRCRCKIETWRTLEQFYLNFQTMKQKGTFKNSNFPLNAILNSCSKKQLLVNSNGKAMSTMVLKKTVKYYWCQLAAIVIDGLVENVDCGLRSAYSTCKIAILQNISWNIMKTSQCFALWIFLKN